MSGLRASPQPLAYDLAGEGPAVVFLHGLTFDRSTWAPIVDRLAPQATCLSVDLPAHGGTGGVPLPVPAVATRVHDLVEDLALDRPVLVGHSMGAWVVTVYAAEFPAAGVVNVDQALDVRPFSQLLRHLEPQLRGAGFAAAFDLFQRGMEIERIPEPLRSAVLRSQDIRPEVVVGYWEEVLGRTPEEMQALVDHTVDSLQQPYLAVFGRRLAEPERTGTLQRVKHLRLEEWLGRGHFPHLAELDCFLDCLRSFVDGCS